MPRSYINNVVYSCVGQPFLDWIKERTEERNEKIKRERGMLVNLDPEVARAFKASTSVSGKYVDCQVSTVIFFILVLTDIHSEPRHWRTANEGGKQEATYSSRDY